VHDYFDIIGLSTNAGGNEVRRACARRVRRAHPDFREVSDAGPVRAPLARVAGIEPVSSDVAIDFVDITTLIEKIQAAFFRSPPPTTQQL
jgi:hypothetical protein